MITSTGVGVGSVGGIGMLRARRRDVSVKPNRKLDRKSSRGMIYENEELRLRTIQINAEVEQGQNDIKKLRRENEQLRREIWCLREEYDKLEDILKTQKTRDDSEGCSDEEEEEEDDDGEDDVSSGSEKKGELEDGQDESTDADEDDDEIHKAKLELTVSNELVKDELFENAENQKLSVEKSNRGHHHMEFDQLSIVDEEEELVKREKKLTDMPEAKSNMQKDTGYTSGHAFNWIINPECGSIPSSKEQSLFCNSTQGISTMINSEGGQAQLLPPTSYIGWQRQVFEGDTDGHTFTTIDGHQTCAESIANGASCRMPRDTSACFSVFSDPLSLAKACEVNAAPSSSSENTSSTIIQKTSPDICVSGAVADHPSRAFGSSDQLLTSNNRDSLSKSYSCQELTKSFGSSMTQGLEAKSLPDNSTPRAFRSQLRVQLTKLPAEKPAEIPPKIPPLDWTLGKSYYGTCESLMRHLPSSDYQATSFESPTPRNLTLPPAAAVSFSTYSRLTRGERKFFPAWPNATASQQVNTQTQTLCRKSNQSASPSASSSSAEHAEDKKDGKSVKPKKKPKKNKLAVSIRSSDNVKIGEDERPERSSSSGVESHRKSRKSNRISAGSKRRASSRSQSVSQVLNNTPDGLAKERGVGLTEQKMRRNSTSSESVPWCACWGNGCV